MLEPAGSREAGALIEAAAELILWVVWAEAGGWPAGRGWCPGRVPIDVQGCLGALVGTVVHCQASWAEAA